MAGGRDHGPGRFGASLAAGRQCLVAETHVEMQREGGVVKLIETNEGEICRCMCGYALEMENTGLPAGRYTVQVWGIQYDDVHPLELLGEATVDL